MFDRQLLRLFLRALLLPRGGNLGSPSACPAADVLDCFLIKINLAVNNSVNDTFSCVTLPEPGSVGANYNFGERPLAGSEVLNVEMPTPYSVTRKR